MNSAVKKGGLTDRGSDIPRHVCLESRRTADVVTPLNKTPAQAPLIVSKRTCTNTQRGKTSKSEINVPRTAPRLSREAH